MYKPYETPQFWVNYGEPLRRYLTRKVLDKSTAEDILHEVYIKIFLHCKRYNFSCEKAGVSNLRAWIFQICHNTMVDFTKENAKVFYMENLPETQIVEPNHEIEQPVIEAEKLIGKLPPRYSVLVFEDVILNTKQADIANKFGLGMSATKSRIQRGKKMLQTLYIAAKRN